MPELMTREEYAAKFGYDPEENAVDVMAAAPADTKVPGARGGFKDHLKSAAVGLLSAPTDVINLPSTVYAGGKALVNSYANDTKFVDEFQKNISVEGGQDNIQKHIDDVARSWMERDPTLTQDEIQNGIKDYQKSKQFEDFKTSQLSGTHYLAAKTRDVARDLVGDDRPEGERSWTESAAEIGGSALVGGPAGWVARAARVPALAGVAANPVGRAAIRTAEAVTPLTIPYNPLNIGINTAAGVGIDQGVRYLQGKPTAFTPTQDDTAGVVALSAGGAGLVGALAFANAIRGRTNQALQAATANPSATSTQLSNMPSLDWRVRNEPRAGEAFMESGSPQELGPSSSLEDMPLQTNARRRARTMLIDQGAAADAAVRDIHGRQVADELEVIRTSNSGAVLNDSVDSNTSNSIRGISDAFSGLTPEDARALQAGWWHTSYASDIDTLIDHNTAEMARLTTQVNRANASPQARSAAQARLTQLQSDMQRLLNDDPTARLRIPETPIAEVRQFSNAFMNDTSPAAMRVKTAVRAFNRDMLDLAVRAEKMTQEAADFLHKRNPYYVQAVNDPLKGATGSNRLFASVSQDINKRLTQASQGTSGAVAHEGPLRHLDKDINEVRPVGSNEIRITAPLDPLSSAANYARQMHRDVAHTRVKNDYVRAMAFSDRRSTPSNFLTDGRMRVVRNPQGGDWWGPGMLHRPEIHRVMSRTDVLDEWQAGHVRLWEFGDPEIVRGLRAEPVLLTGLMKGANTSSNILKFFLTGRGNPAFALKGALYDTGIAMFTVPKGRVFGTASYLGARIAPRISSTIFKYIPDVTAYSGLPWHAFASFVELQAYHMSNALARYLPSQVPGFAALRATVGQRMFQRMLQTALRVASWAEQRPAVALHRAGATRGAQTIDNIPQVRTAFTQVKDRVPAPARALWQFYTDILDSFYLANKRQYYSQNYALESIRHRGRVPDVVNERLINETRRMAGDMSLMPASKLMQDLERSMPYLTQTKLGAYHLTRNMFSRDTAMSTNSRLLVGMSGVAMSVYMMTYWDDAARDYYWNRTPEYDRYKYVFIPSPRAWLRWVRGEQVPFDPSLVYKVPVPPDIAGIIAGTIAFMQMLGGIPADATVKPISRDVMNVFIDSITPAMPPLLNAMAGAAGYKIDPQSSETRGGNWIRSLNSTFRAGPQAEAATTLGEVSNSTSLMLSALFGSFGAHLATATDIMMHAAKFHPQPGPDGRPVARDTPDFGAGLRAATSRVFRDTVNKVPDVPMLWKGEERAVATTPAWRYVTENMNHVRAIVGMRDHATGKTSQLNAQQASRIGGVAQQAVTDRALIAISQEVSAWYRPSGPLGKLRAEYIQLAKQAGSVRAQYNMPHEQRRQLLNRVVTAQQDNMIKQQQSVQLAEQYLAQKYGQALAPRLGKRLLNMTTLDQMMRESLGAPNLKIADEQ